MKIKRPKRIKLANQVPSIKQLDDLAREYVRLRDKKCRVCGGSDYLQTAHFISRSNKAVRWDEDNIFLLCAGDHTMRNTSWHKDPGGATEFVKGALGEKKYRELRLRAAGVKKVDRNIVRIYLLQKIKSVK